MHVEPDGREPVLVKDLAYLPGLELSVHVHVAVIVMANVRMIEPRHGSGFEVAAHVLVVPVHDQGLAVRIETRYEKDNGVVENLLGPRAVVRSEVMR